MNHLSVKIISVILVAALLIICASCGLQPTSISPPEKHTIPYPDEYNTETAGASAFKSMGDHYDSPYFKHPDFYNMKSSGTLTILSNFKTYQQSTEFHCGPAAALMVLNYYGVTDVDELTIGKGMKTHQGVGGGEPVELVEMGTTVSGMVDYFNSIGWSVQSPLTGDAPFAEDDVNGFRDWVIANLKDATPVMAEWLDWGGHWQVIIGYDTMGTDHFGDDILIMADPYDTSDHYQDGYYIVNAQRFFYMWFDTLYQLEDQQVKQWVIVKP